jgi:hypothetical protein
VPTYAWLAVHCIFFRRAVERCRGYSSDPAFRLNRNSEREKPSLLDLFSVSAAGMTDLSGTAERSLVLIAGAGELAQWTSCASPAVVAGAPWPCEPPSPAS